MEAIPPPLPGVVTTIGRDGRARRSPPGTTMPASPPGDTLKRFAIKRNTKHLPVAVLECSGEFVSEADVLLFLQTLHEIRVEWGLANGNLLCVLDIRSVTFLEPMLVRYLLDQFVHPGSEYNLNNLFDTLVVVNSRASLVRETVQRMQAPGLVANLVPSDAGPPKLGWCGEFHLVDRSRDVDEILWRRRTGARPAIMRPQARALPPTLVPHGRYDTNNKRRRKPNRNGVHRRRSNRAN